MLLEYGIVEQKMSRSWACEIKRPAWRTFVERPEDMRIF
jgi:hypothetical protein